MADALGLGPSSPKGVEVQVLSRPQKIKYRLLPVILFFVGGAGKLIYLRERT